MAPLSLGAVALALAFAFHVALWRLRTPRRQTRTLLAIFFGFLAAALAVGTLAPAHWPCALHGLHQCFQTACLVVSFTLAYVITYSAVEADSPTLVLIRTIADAHPGGLPTERLFELANDDVLVRPRFLDLLRDGLVEASGDRRRLTAKGRRFVAVFIAYRRLLGAGKGG